MADKGKGPATAPTVPGHGSIIPQKETKMNDHLDITKATTKPVSRRNFIAAAAAAVAAPAVALAGANGKTSRLPQPVEVQEKAWVRVRRLAKDLGEALIECDGGAWFAKVYPKNEARGWSVLYGDIQAEHEARLHIEPKLFELIDAHKRAYAAYCVACNLADDILLGREPTKAEELRRKKSSQAEVKALADLLAYVPWNDPSRYMKATYVLPFTANAQFSEKQMRVLLLSMCGRCA